MTSRQRRTLCKGSTRMVTEKLVSWIAPTEEDNNSLSEDSSVVPLSSPESRKSSGSMDSSLFDDEDQQLSPTDIIEQKPNIENNVIKVEDDDSIFLQSSHVEEEDASSQPQAKRIKIRSDLITTDDNRGESNETTTQLSSNGSSANGHIENIETEHKNGEIDDTEIADFNLSIGVIKSEAEDLDLPSQCNLELTSSIASLEKEVGNLDCLLVAKELEWNALLKLKKLKEVLLEQLRREDELGHVVGQYEDYDLKSLLRECIMEQKKIVEIESQAKSTVSLLRNETSKAELEITESSGRRFRRLLPKEDPLQLEQRDASKALQNLCAKNVGTVMNSQDTRQGPKGPLVQVTSLIADYRAKRNNEQLGGRRHRSMKSLSPASQMSSNIRYSDVLLSLAKISESKLAMSTSDVSTTNSHQNKLGGRGGGTGSIPTNASLKSNNLTLAKLLTSAGSTNSGSGSDGKPTLDDYKGRHNSAISAETHISLSNLLASNQKTRNEQAIQKAESVPVCQGCNTNQAQFVCAGCGNQWYCSRDCQVEAWDEHAESCSG